MHRALHKGAYAMKNLSEILKKYNCIPVRVDINGSFILNVLGNYDETGEFNRTFPFSEFVYIDDFPTLMNTFNDFTSGTKNRMYTHFRLEFESELHWAYLCCEKSSVSTVFDGVLMDVYEYLECIPNDNVISEFENRQSRKISDLNKNGATIEEICGKDYLEKIQLPFVEYGVDSAVFDEKGNVICEKTCLREHFDIESYKYVKKAVIRFNYKDGGYWCIGTDDRETAEKMNAFLSTLCEGVSRMSHSVVLLYNEMQNSKAVNRQLGANVEQQMLVNSIHSIIMEETQSETALKRVLETVGNYLHLDRVAVYSPELSDGKLVTIASWQSVEREYETESYLKNNYSDVLAALGGTENYFSRGAEEQIKLFGLSVFALSEIYGNEKSSGLVAYESYEKDRKWSYNDRKIIRSVSQSVSNIMQKCEMDKKIEEKNQQLYNMAFYDNMLGIKNRAKLDYDVGSALLDSESGIVMAVQVVNTRSLNEVFGQGYTDRLLRLIAEFLGEDEIGGESVYRYSGSIMMLVLKGYSPDKAQTTAQNILKRFSHPFIIDDVEQYAEVSIGVAVFDPSVAESEDLYRAATLSLYRANEYGRNSMAFFNREFHSASGAVYNLEQELRRCIADNMRNFELTYQPVYNGETLHHYETLLRWKSENIGYVSPRVFMRLMEKVGLDSAIDFWVIPKACTFCRRARDVVDKNVRVSVNLTIHEMQSGAISGVVQNALSDTGLEPDALIVEVPEGAHVLAYNETASTLGKLKKQGVSICIDSFGNEYLPLNTLKYSYIDMIKVSSSFITNSGDSFDEALVRTTVSLAANKGIEVAVKNVEHKAQMWAAEAFDIRIVQGGFISTPKLESEILTSE